MFTSLLFKGTSVELTNNSGQTPLFCAAYCGHLDIVKLLLKLGADPNRRCSINCCTPVHAACWSGNQSLITSLLIAGMKNYIRLNSDFLLNKLQFQAAIYGIATSRIFLLVIGLCFSLITKAAWLPCL